MIRLNRLTALAAVVALSLGLAACGGGSSSTATMDPEPTAYETATAAIAAATTDAAVDKAVADAMDGVTGTQLTELQAKAAARKAVLATMARVAAQKMALMEAAGMIDTSDLSTAELIAAANTAIAALQMALDAAADVSDADKAMYQSQLDTASAAVRMAQTGLDTAGRMAMQRMAITDAVAAARTAVGMVDNDATDAEVTAADAAVAALKAALDGAADLAEGDADVVGARATLTTLEGQLASAKQSRTAAMAAAEEERRKAEEEAARKAAAAMAATAAKLHAGIYAPADAATGTDVGDVHAAYNDADAPNTGDAADTFIMVTTGDGTAANTEALSEDKDATVAALRGWMGKRYAASGTDVAGTYEAMVYSHVGPATEGEPFNEEYTLNADGETGDITALTGYVTGRVASPRFTQSAGTMEFTLPENTERVVVPGSYHGVSGTYYCTPTDANTKCSAAVAASGFTLDGGTWSFKPGTATAKVMSVPDASYASFGWWLHTAANGDLTASAFVDRKGATAAASGIDALNGTATYVGGAVGKYALSSTTGGTNDAGHFTARATLNANFTTNTAATAITGTIDQFMGADGMSRDWMVKLNGSPITDAGLIGEDGDATAGNAMTVWTIGGTAADAAGNWNGSLQENGDDDGVPAIATGTFHSTYGTAGKMVGAFGANKQ